MNNLTVHRAENLQLNMIFIERRRKKMLLILDVIAVYLIIKVLEVFVWPRVDSYLKKNTEKGGIMERINAFLDAWYKTHN
jgi:hypothetical protein